MTANTITELSHAIKNSGATIIGVDGYLGVGKTSLAIGLARQTGYGCIHLDNYLEPQKGSFVKNLNLLTLKEAINQRPLIIEGICLLEVLCRLNINSDFLVYVAGVGASHKKIDKIIFDEVDKYLKIYRPTQKADVIFNMDKYNTNSSNEIDIAYIKAQTAISIVLAAGGILSILVGALVFTLGLQAGDTALIKVSGAEISAKGIGGVILATSAAWAYFSYLSKPQYNRTREIKESKKNDGSFERHEFESRTQVRVRPNKKT